MIKSPRKTVKIKENSNRITTIPRKRSDWTPPGLIIRGVLNRKAFKRNYRNIRLPWQKASLFTKTLRKVNCRLMQSRALKVIQSPQY
ncbi:hypothetical protein [Endozoicomonas sp. GU-1]|uniref:hypothetical protein n=1 Tax=Endozoicomonas sp. GU-1 TaxID=3009078 RepID=UPI0022B5AF21|nr:hypothetical protein [Endozoicomonas sp. GU-1]WBA79800.1 hypothetical protein O2T12_15680 [Endozoicomonas sp. GU-1]